MKLNIITATIVTSLLTTICIAEEADVKDPKDFSFRVSLGTAPGTDEFDVDGGDDGSLDDDVGARLELLAVKRFWKSNESTVGGMFGGGIFFAGHSGEDDFGDDVDTSAFGFLLQGGLAARAGEVVVLEFGPYLGFGIAENDVSGFDDGTGPYGLFGIKGGVFVSLSEKVELGLEVGYEGFATEQEFEIFGSDVDVTFSGSGARVAGVLAIKF